MLLDSTVTVSASETLWSNSYAQRDYSPIVAALLMCIDGQHAERCVIHAATAIHIFTHTYDTFLLF